MYNNNYNIILKKQLYIIINVISSGTLLLIISILFNEFNKLKFKKDTVHLLKSILLLL